MKMVLRCEYDQMSHASGWQELHLSATKERRGLSNLDYIINRGALMLLLSALSGLLHASWAVGC